MKSDTDSVRDHADDEEQIKKLTNECSDKMFKLQNLENGLYKRNSGFCFAVFKTE